MSSAPPTVDLMRPPRSRRLGDVLLAAVFGVGVALFPTAAAFAESTAAETEPSAPLPPPITEGLRFVAPLFLANTFVDAYGAELERLRIVDERENRVYIDVKTGLMWPRNDNAADVSWKRAKRYCDDLVLAGHDDWRLPTIEELEGLHRPMSVALFKLPPEIQLSSCCPWSSTTTGENTGLNYSFRYRKRFSGTLSYSYDLRALCVRQITDADRAEWVTATLEALKKKNK